MRNIKILFRGMWRTLHGAGLAAAICQSVYTLTLVRAADGYDAVLFFLLASAMLLMCFRLMWCMGGGKKHSGDYERKGNS